MKLIINLQIMNQNMQISRMFLHISSNSSKYYFQQAVAKKQVSTSQSRAKR